MRCVTALITAAILACVACGAVPALAAERDDGGRLGLGVMFGEPTGLSGKLWTSARTAFDIGAAWSFQGKGHFHLHADYLIHNFRYFEVDKGSLPFYLGIGGRIRFHDEKNKIGVRFVAGLEYFMEEWPIAFFVEVAPILDLAPETEGDINGGLGIRFYF